MKLQALAAITLFAVASSVWANDGDNAKRDATRQTRAGVDALANAAKNQPKQGAKSGVRVLANVRKQREDPDPTADKPTAVERPRTYRQASDRPDADTPDLVRPNRTNAHGGDSQFNRQFGAVGRPNGAYQWGGFTPNGMNFNQVNGYRSFPTRYGWGNGFGYGFGYGYPYFVPTYYSFGFTPVVFGLSGPVVTRYADPLGRQQKQMMDGILKSAERR